MKGGWILNKIIITLAAAALVAAVPIGIRRAAGAAGETPAKTAVRIDAEGKLLVPPALLKQAGFGPGTELEAEWTGQEIVLRKRVKMEKTASGLQYTDVVVGQGAAPKAGQTVVVHYTGWLANG